MMQVWSQHHLPDGVEELPDALVLSGNDPPFTNKHPTSEQFTQYSIDTTNQLINAQTQNPVGISIDLKNGQDKILSVLGSVEWVLVTKNNDEEWQMIPAENLIAAAQNTGTKLCFCVECASDVGGLARALELGVDALCVDANSATKKLWETVFKARAERQKQSLTSNRSIEDKTKSLPSIQEGVCWRQVTKDTILGDRICVDLVQSLAPSEGCWIGSSAKVMACVLSEAATSQYVPSRPFRVNAGPVHSYILLADHSTKYLCELEPGDHVSVYNSETGASRNVAVGRLKVEVRPCVLIRMETTKEEVQPGQIFLQQAETVRLAQTNGEFIRVTDLDTAAQDSNEPSAGEKDCMKYPLLIRTTICGTHVGQTYTGSVEEK